MKPSLTRRQALSLFGLGAAGAALSTAAVQSAPTGTTTFVYPFSIGSFKAVAISDGISSLDSVQPPFAPEASPEELKQILEQNFQPTDHVNLYFNVLLVDTGRERVLVDGGYGAKSQPKLGNLLAGLSQAGHQPERDLHRHPVSRPWGSFVRVSQ
jgi:hypothetical protein